MNIPPLTSQFLLFLIVLNTCFAGSKYGEDLNKPGCSRRSRMSIDMCNLHDFKLIYKVNSVSWSPKKTINMTLEELKAPCDDKFVCLENTGCFKDYINYQELDGCIEDFFKVGPWSFCEDKMREVNKKNPEQLDECTKSRFALSSSPEKVDCLSIYETAKCYLKDVERHCEPEFFELYKEHYRLRLYNRACDGRLRYKDWDYRNGKDFAIDISPGVFKVSDPKRDYNSTGSYSDFF